MKLLDWLLGKEEVVAEPLPDSLEAMSIDQLIEYKLERKRKIEGLRSEIKEAHVIYNRKVVEWHATEALKRVGLEGIVVSPGPGHLELTPKEVQ